MGNTGLTTRTSAEPHAMGLRDLFVALAMVAGAVVILLPAWKDIYRIGMKDEECSYVLLAPVVVAWLMWIRRQSLRNCPVRRLWVGLLALAAGFGVYWYGYRADPVIWRAGAVMLAVAAFVTAVGFDVAWRLLPALAACVFLIPVDPTGRYHIAAPLQTVTAGAAQQVCEVLGMSVARAGNLLSINGVDVTIAEACNGMRMVLTLFMVCYVVAFTVPARAYVRVLILAASPVVAVIANVVRLVPTVWMFGHTSREAAERFHDVSGWVMTVVAFVALMGLLRLFTDVPDGSKDSSPGGRTSAAKGGLR